MAVIPKWMCDRDNSMHDSKKAADEHDKMLELAEEFTCLLENHIGKVDEKLAEEFGLIGGMSLLVLYGLIVFFCVVSASQNKDRYGSLLTLGIASTLFLFFAVNMSMVMGLAPVVGVPLPLVSFGGTAMLVLLAAFGLVQSAHVHRLRTR